MVYEYGNLIIQYKVINSCPDTLLCCKECNFTYQFPIALFIIYYLNHSN